MVYIFYPLPSWFLLFIQDVVTRLKSNKYIDVKISYLFSFPFTSLYSEPSSTLTWAIRICGIQL